MTVALALFVGLAVGFVAGLFSIRWATRKTEAALREFERSTSGSGVVDETGGGVIPS
jgi:hypothetical protein